MAYSSSGVDGSPHATDTPPGRKTRRSPMRRIITTTVLLAAVAAAVLGGSPVTAALATSTVASDGFGWDKNPPTPKP